MVESVDATDRENRQPCQFSLTYLLFLTFSVAIGLSFWKTEQDWYVGALAAISFWIVLGLAAQVWDIWCNIGRGNDLASDERWGRRFAIAWRLAICFLIGACFLVRLLVTFHILALNDGQDIVYVSSQEMWISLLLISIVIAVSSSPSFARPARRRPWSWVVNVLGGVAACLLFMIVASDRFCISALVHITITGIQASWPFGYYSADMMAAASAARVVWFFNVATTGVILVLVSCGLLWRLSLRWRQANWQKLSLGVLLAASLTAMLLLTARVVFVEFPFISPILAANMNIPSPIRLAAPVLLVLLLATVVAYRWSKPLPDDADPAGLTCRCSRKRYYHESLALMLMLGIVAIIKCVDMAYRVYGCCFPMLPPSWTEVGWIFTSPVGCLSFALVLLTARGVFSKPLQQFGTILVEPPRLNPSLFLLVWSALLAIIVCSVPLLAAWGFGFWLRLGC